MRRRNSLKSIVADGWMAPALLILASMRNALALSIIIGLGSLASADLSTLDTRAGQTSGNTFEMSQSSEMVESAPAAGNLYSDEVRPVQGPLEHKAWTYQGSSCRTCPLRIVPARHLDVLQTDEAQAFIKALEIHKQDLLALYSDYGVSSQDYNLLAQIAVGILGQESLFFGRYRPNPHWYNVIPRYRYKETPVGQMSIRLWKYFMSSITNSKDSKYRTVTANSRGPTQIKIIPKRIASFYNFEESELGVPENAALATMGFLIESLRTLRRLAVNYKLNEVQPATYVDYLPYLYFGWKKYLINGTAQPYRNVYVRNMKKYMSWIKLYEVTDDAALTPLP